MNDIELTMNVNGYDAVVDRKDLKELGLAGRVVRCIDSGPEHGGAARCISRSGRSTGRDG